jgi:hypothetical protein
MSTTNLRIKCPRDHTVHRQNKKDINESALEYPLYYVQHSLKFCPNMIRKIILIESVYQRARHNNFPDNVREYFWINNGQNDGISWLCIGQLNTGAYFFYSAYCNTDGFDGNGDMSLYVSTSFKNIIEYGMDDDEYQLYISDTET